MTENDQKFSKEELHLILNTLGRKSFNSESRECVGRCLAAKKQKGVAIDEQAIAICMNECKKNMMDSDVHTSPVERVMTP